LFNYRKYTSGIDLAIIHVRRAQEKLQSLIDDTMLFAHLFLALGRSKMKFKLEG